MKTYWTETAQGEPESGLDVVGGNIVVEVAPGATTYTMTYDRTEQDSWRKPEQRDIRQRHNNDAKVRLESEIRRVPPRQLRFRQEHQPGKSPERRSAARRKESAQRLSTGPQPLESRFEGPLAEVRRSIESIKAYGSVFRCSSR